MAYPSSQNIDPALRPSSLTSPPKPRDSFQNGTPASSHFSPLQASPNPSYQGIPTPAYYPPPQTQESPEGAEDEQSPSGNPNDPNDIKRPRACEACRQLKVKCELDDKNPTGSCKRCAKAGRQCIITAPSRKRQKKTDSRVAELEKKIDALTATLASRGGSDPDPMVEHQHQHPPQHPHPMHHPQSHAPPVQPALRPSVYHDQWTAADRPPPSGQSPSPAPHGVKRKIGPEFEYPFGGELPRPNPSGYQSSKTSNPQYNAMYSSELPRRDEAEYPPMDPITHGLLDVHIAKKCFDRYMAEMCNHLPIVVFPPGTRWEEIRKNKPILFLAVLAVASGTIRPDLQTRLISEVTRILSDRIVYRGEKSMELVQSIQCITTFYQPPEKYEELNFNQLIHIAAVMALDLGMGKRFKKGSLALWRSHTENKRPLPDPNSAETKRAWLGCYYMCSNSAMSLRRPLLIRWSPYAEECIEILSTATDALPTDKWLCLLVRGQHIGEDIGFQFSMDDPASQLSLTDHKTQYHLKAFERQLAEWEESATPDMIKKPVMKHTKGILNLYMHEIAMHHNHNIDDFRPPFNATPMDGPPDPDFVTPAHVESLSTCMNSVHEAFDAFLSMDTKLLRALPTLFFVRNSYAAVALIKMYTAVSAQGSKFGKIIKTEDLKVDEYLDRLISTLQKTAEGGMCKVALKFSMIFNMIRQLHVRRNDPSSGDGSNPVSRQRTPLNVQRPQQQQHQPHQPAYRTVPPQQDPSSLGWNSRGSISHDKHHSQHQQQRNGLQMLSDAAMQPHSHTHTHQHQNQQPQPQQGNTPNQSMQQHTPPQWIPTPHQNQQNPPPQQAQSQQQQQLQQNQQLMPGMPVDPNLGLYPVDGMGDVSNVNLDLDLMAYGFGDEFMAMGFGMGMGIEGGGGWRF